jgi:hypothetical protein
MYLEGLQILRLLLANERRRVLLISHAHKFIFIKPRKVAGTSVELAFSPFLKAGDLATPIEVEEELTRKYVDGLKIGKIGEKLRDHSPLAKAYTTLGESIQAYKVVTIERNPWDRAVSQFFWSMRHSNLKDQSFSDQKYAFAKYTRRWGPTTWEDKLWGRKRQRSLSSYDLYSISGKSKADFVLFFETLEADLARCGDWLNFDHVVQLQGKTKATSRPKDGPHWRDFFDNDLQSFVSQHCHREISAYGYQFDPDVMPRFRPFIKSGQSA